MADLVIAPGVVVPDEALEWRTARSGGPGGQNVNKVETKVELRVAVERITGLNFGARRRLAALAGKRMSDDGTLLVTATETRSQLANRDLALDKLVELIKQSLVAPKLRRPTRATRSSQEKRMEKKKAHGQKKQLRGRVKGD